MNNKTLMAGLVVVIVLIGGIILLTNKGKTNQNTPVETAVPQVQSRPTPTTSPTEEATSSMKKTEETTAKGSVKEFTITGSPFKDVPNKISAKKGDMVKITFKNSLGTHDFVIDEFKVRTKILPAGGEETVQFVASKTGTYNYYCSVDSHRAQGMEGILTVE